MTPVIIYNLNTFENVVPQAVAGCYSIKKVFFFIKFTGTWGIKLASPNETCKDPENTLYFGGVFRIQSNIYDGAFCQNIYG